MANTKSAIKRVRQNDKTRRSNASARSMYRTFVKSVLKAVEAGEATEAQAAFQRAKPILDKAAGKGLIHKNKAARIKHRLSLKVKALG